VKAPDADPPSDRLLPGEDVLTPYADDIEHWIEVYQELVLAQEGLVEQLRQDRLSQAQPGDLQNSALVIELGRLRRHLAFWMDRKESGVNRARGSED
jgi:hypothetical protein